MSRAMSAKKLPAQVIGELVRGEIAREAEPALKLTESADQAQRFPKNKS
jgi:hypothetical protein